MSIRSSNPDHFAPAAMMVLFGGDVANLLRDKRLNPLPPERILLFGLIHDLEEDKFWIERCKMTGDRLPERGESVGPDSAPWSNVCL
jgi:hypothetical protein